MKKKRRVVLGEGRLRVWSQYNRWVPSSVTVENGLYFSKRMLGKRGKLIFEWEQK